MPCEGESLLDVATGPGTMARLAAERLGNAGRVVGTDISDAMLAIARGKPTVAGASIEYIESAADRLPLPAGTFDVVTCVQALQFFPDAAAGLREMRRVLRSGGRLGLAVWGPLPSCEHFAAIDAAIDEAEMPAAWHDGVHAPFRGPAPEALAELMAMAGFKDVHIDRVTLSLCFEGGLQQAVESLAVTPLAAPLDAQPAESRDRFLNAFRRRLSPYITENGVVTRLTATVAIAQTP